VRHIHRRLENGVHLVAIAVLCGALALVAVPLPAGAQTPPEESEPDEAPPTDENEDDDAGENEDDDAGENEDDDAGENEDDDETDGDVPGLDIVPEHEDPDEQDDTLDRDDDSILDADDALPDEDDPSDVDQDDHYGQDTPRGDPHGGAESWMLPPPKKQLEKDSQLRPAAMGGLFVPAMTGSRLEPRYHVITPDGEEIEQEVGKVTYVLPGTYTVRVGSGPPEDMLEFEAEVVEGQVTFIPVEWGGVVIQVVNERGTPFRGSYELVRLPEREYVGLGLGADIASGETLDTWLLWPGKYMILAAGESYQARKNFATFRVLPGELVQYTIVLDENTGELLGAGEIALAPETAGEGGWDVNIILGGSVEFNHVKDVVGRTSGQTLDVAAFIETVGAFLTKNHYVYGRLNIELGGAIRLEGPDIDDPSEEPFVTDVDELALDLLYTYRVLPWFGPYVRGSGETNMLKGVLEFSEPTDVRRLESDGETLISLVPDALDVDLTESFAPIELDAGTGVRFDYSAGFWFSIDARTGLGIRQVFARDSFIVDDDNATPELELRQLSDLTQFGAEAALILEFNPFQWLQLKTDSNLLLPFDTPEQPLFDFRGAITIRLGSIASLNYTIRVQEDRRLVDATQIDQSVLLRFAYKLL